MADWLSSDATFDGIKMHYYRTGGDKPPIVLNHGATDDGLCWTPTARALEPDYDVIMPDARGHGLSDDTTGAANSEQRAHDLAGFVRALGLQKPVVGGHSMGASTTLYFAALYPDVPSKAILEDPGLWTENDPSEESARAERMARIRENSARMRAMSRDQLIAYCRKQNPTWAEEELGPWADSKMRVKPSMGFSRGQPTSLTWQEALARITCPVLLLTSEVARGGIVTPEAAAEAQAVKPSLGVVNIAGAGHNIRREQFGAFLEAVRGFLAE